MKDGLVPGVQAELTFEVTDNMCPIFEEAVVHPVCATWTVVRFMEVASRKVLIGHLDSNEEGVGSRVICDHLGPAKIGRTVRVVATVADVTGHELVCDTAAFVGERKIARGQTVQRILPRPALERVYKRG